mgnify:CR=1 FL=1
MSLSHDPRCKQVIKEEILSFIYEPVKKNYINRLIKIIARNDDIHKTNQGCFRYRGEIYKREKDIVLPRKINSLHDSLKGEMDQYIADLEHLNSHEFPYVSNFVNQMLNATNSFQDYYAILPESMHQPLINLAKTCPCVVHHLDHNSIQNIRIQNTHSIELLKERLVKNLLL